MWKRNALVVALLTFFCWSSPSIALSQAATSPLDVSLLQAALVDVPKAEDESLRVGALLSEFGREVAGLPSRDTAITLALGGALAFAVHPIDESLSVRATQTGGGGFDRAFPPGDVIGAGWFQGSAALATFVVGQATGNHRVRAVGLDLVQAGGIVYLVTKSLKFSVDRERPDGGRYSFPSGHAAATFANATVLHRHFGWKAGLPAYGLAAYVSASRLPDQKHYASDIAFGAAIGLMAGRSMTIGRKKATSFDVTPMAVPGGAGVVVRRAAHSRPAPPRS